MRATSALTCLDMWELQKYWEWSCEPSRSREDCYFHPIHVNREKWMAEKRIEINREKWMAKGLVKSPRTVTTLYHKTCHKDKVDEAYLKYKSYRIYIIH